MTSPRLVCAGLDDERECAHCGGAIVSGEFIAVCTECGAPHHEPCWRSEGGCSSASCAPRPLATFRPLTGSRPPAPPRDRDDVLRITAEELRRTAPHSVPLPYPSVPPGSVLRVAPPDYGDGDPWSAESRVPRNRIAAAALLVAVAGILLFGVVTGLLAVVIACVALLKHRSGERGLWMAGAAALLGIADFIGWTILLSYWTSGP